VRGARSSGIRRRPAEAAAVAAASNGSEEEPVGKERHYTWTAVENITDTSTVYLAEFTVARGEPETNTGGPGLTIN